MTRIEALRQIVATKKAAKIDGHVVDTFTASRILASYKTMEGTERRRFASMTVDKMVTASQFSSNEDKSQWVNAIDLRIKDTAETLRSVRSEVAIADFGPRNREYVNNLLHDIDTAISFINSTSASIHDLKTVKV